MIIIKSYYYIFNDANVKQFSRPKIILNIHFKYLIAFCYKMQFQTTIFATKTFYLCNPSRSFLLPQQKRSQLIISQDLKSIFRAFEASRYTNFRQLCIFEALRYTNLKQLCIFEAPRYTNLKQLCIFEALRYTNLKQLCIFKAPRYTNLKQLCIS